VLMRERERLKQMCVGGGEGVEPLSDIGKQRNNGPHQIHIFDNPTALCLALGKQNLDLALGGTDVANRFLCRE